MNELYISTFLLSLIPLGVARLLWLREHIVETWEERERIQGRFTGAKRRMSRLDNGKVGEHDILPMFLILPSIFIVPILLLSYFFIP